MKRALFVGLNDYPAPNTLGGCVADATGMRDMLSKNEDDSPNFQGILLTTANEVTRDGLTGSITQLFAQPADVALLYFSGHGYLDNNLGGYLVTSDATQYSMGLRMSDVLELANSSPVKEVFVILDCCHSGNFGQAPASQGQASSLNEGRSILMASRGTESALEINGEGVFTRHVLAALQGGAADILGKVTSASIYAYLDEVLGAWDQRPLFKANISRLHSLRMCKPQVPLEILRRLPTYFSTVDAVLALDPSYEPTETPKNEANEKVFAELQKLRAARLVEPVGEEHMYYAALNSKGCRLSQLGQFYWRLAKDSKI